MTEPLYYAKDGYVWKRSIHTKVEGGTEIEIGFRVCKMCPEVGDEVAETIAEVLNRAHESGNTEGKSKFMEPLYFPDGTLVRCRQPNTVMCRATSSPMAERIAEMLNRASLPAPDPTLLPVSVDRLFHEATEAYLAEIKRGMEEIGRQFAPPTANPADIEQVRAVIEGAVAGYPTVETHAKNIALAIVKYYGSPPQARMTAEMAFLAWNRGTTRERFAALDIATLTDQEHEAARVNALFDGSK